MKRKKGKGKRENPVLPVNGSIEFNRQNCSFIASLFWCLVFAVTSLEVEQQGKHKDHKPHKGQKEVPQLGPLALHPPRRSLLPHLGEQLSSPLRGGYGWDQGNKRQPR